MRSSQELCTRRVSVQNNIAPEITLEIPLSQGFIALISMEDAERVCKYKWYVTKGKWSNYAQTEQVQIEDSKSTYLHRFILNPVYNLYVHHRNNNGLDCRRSNIEISSRSDNARKSSLRPNKTAKYRGVYFYKSRNKYIAEITIDYKKTYLGSFSSEEEAALAYNNAVMSLLGPGYLLNVIK